MSFDKAPDEAICNQMKNIAGEKSLMLIEEECNKITFNKDLMAMFEEGENNSTTSRLSGESCNSDVDYTRCHNGQYQECWNGVPQWMNFDGDICDGDNFKYPCTEEEAYEIRCKNGEVLGCYDGFWKTYDVITGSESCNGDEIIDSCSEEEAWTTRCKNGQGQYCDPDYGWITDFWTLCDGNSNKTCTNKNQYTCEDGNLIYCDEDGIKWLDNMYSPSCDGNTLNTCTNAGEYSCKNGNLIYCGSDGINRLQESNSFSCDGDIFHRCNEGDAGCKNGGRLWICDKNTGRYTGNWSDHPACDGDRYRGTCETYNDCGEGEFCASNRCTLREGYIGEFPEGSSASSEGYIRSIRMSTSLTEDFCKSFGKSLLSVSYFGFPTTQGYYCSNSVPSFPSCPISNADWKVLQTKFGKESFALAEIYGTVPVTRRHLELKADAPTLNGYKSDSSGSVALCK